MAIICDLENKHRPWRKSFIKSCYFVCGLALEDMHAKWNVSYFPWSLTCVDIRELSDSFSSPYGYQCFDN